MEFSAVVAVAGVGILLTALYLQSESFVSPMVSAIMIQSLILAALLGWLAWFDQNVDLAILAALTVVFRVVIIPYLLRRQIRAFRWRARELRAAHRVTGHALAAVTVAVIAWFVAAPALSGVFAAPGGALAFVLLAQGLLMLSTRTNTIVQVTGYLEEENAIVYGAALLAGGLPLLIEVVVFLDVLGVVLVGIILTVQRAVSGVPEEAVPEELTG